MPARTSSSPWPGRGWRHDDVRSRLARDHVEPPDQHHRGMLGDDLAHGFLHDHRRGPGLRLRAAGRGGELHRSLPALDAGLQPHPAARGAGAARVLPGRRPARRGRPDHQRSLDLRRPSLRPGRGHARLPPGRPGRPRRINRPLLRRGRHEGFLARPRGLRRGDPDPAPQTVPPGRAEPGAGRADPPQRP